MAGRAPGPAQLQPGGGVAAWTESRAHYHAFSLVAGVDEAGRGAWAGPLVAAAVALGPRPPRGLRDSKQLSADARERLAGEIRRTAVAWSTVVVAAADIDRWGLQRMNLLALRRAVAKLAPSPSLVVVDGFQLDGLPVPSLSVHRADAVVRSVAAASILAKTERDRIMRGLAVELPEYGFDQHKGYGTGVHAAALAACGPSREHRLSFAPVGAARRGVGG